MIAFSKTSALRAAVLTAVMLLFVVKLSSAAEGTPRPTYCTKTSDCGSPSTHQDCVNGTCGCIIGYTWDNDVFICTVRHCQKDDDCHFLWPHSVCSNAKSGMCVCDKKFHVDKKTQTCQPGPPSSAQSNHGVLMLVVIASFGASFLLQLF